MKRAISRPLIYLFIFLVSCKAYKQDIMFELDDEFTSAVLESSVDQAIQNYRLQADDWIQVEVFTNDGERLIDPNFELGGGQGGMQMNQFRSRYQYLIQLDGHVKLPLVGKQKVEGLTVDEAEQVLEKSFNELYVGSFVKMKVVNRRVIVLGGEGGRVIPIENENTSLLEVLALYGGLSLGTKAQNIRVIRGDLNDPQIFIVDLSSVSRMKQTIIDIESGDVIYIEPWRRPWMESLKDVSPVLGVATSVLTFVFLIINL